ncbi:phytanoyl-CoA dioxygenase family protein [Sphingomonas sp. 8AM]|uniref:phytanoyl-CoA dioxygenase family protein n=1 Tax=Sphingomonas sp. 8AM TaxID=2653170 RepID=UPI0012F069A0|nr:phytanoyl-CoA dioxygenase family protein [Sphingomonas sp. 8AM]VXC75230.1 Phytanoyl-CoA dioxygenase [Sphingomonas sp. 8AM]
MTATLELARGGAAHHPAAATSLFPTLHQLAVDLPQERAGLRPHGHPSLPALLAAGAIHAIAAHHLGRAAQPVRPILFDKTTAMNWSLGWHQERTIAVQARADVPGYGPWSTKQGIQHVEPPFAITEAMVTLRLHLDDTPVDNAPLLIAPGSHRFGRIAEDAIADTLTHCGTVACLASAGDVWSYATPILHASAIAQGNRRLRVLQVDYAATALPAPLVWLGL